VLLARALVSRPDVLLLDEVLNGLDTASRRAFVRSLRTATLAGATWVLSTHRAADRPPGVTHVARLDRGGLFVREVDGRDAIGRRGHRRKGNDAATGIANRRAAPSQAPLLTLKGVAVYREERRILHGIDWTVNTGQHWAVTGPNGSGKSTLFALLYGDLHPSLGGRLLRDGLAPGTPIEEWKHRVGFVSPELQATYAATACTVEEIVASGVHSSIGLNERPSAAELAHARTWIDRVGLQGLSRRRARQLSYGQLRLALFARALIVPRQVLLLDEPFDGLDASSRAIAERVVGAAVEQGAQIILGTHHVEDIPAFIRHRLDLRDGTARARRAN
jgi:molybdate transport system ATP-binding protein